jgi:hypothetical protein
VSGDFGYGWSLSIFDPDIFETTPQTTGADSFFGEAPLRMGDKIYLTDPNGDRVGFTFEPTAQPGLLGTIWLPNWVPDPGNFDTLTVDPVPLQEK